MSASIQFTPLTGEDARDSCCYLLEIEECRILLDCGWDWSMGTQNSASSLLEVLQRVAADIDCVLLSHADLEHLGALPIAVAKMGLNCPIFATLPVHRIGKLLLYDTLTTASHRTTLNFTYEDIDTAWDKVTPLKYSQEISLPGRGDGIVVTPYAAGHSLGGAIWKIAKENEEIAYAVQFNHRKERHLNGTVMESVFNKPSVLITDAYAALSTYVSRKDRDAKFCEKILETIRKGGSVLLPVDFAGRTLELFMIVHSFWESKKLFNSYKLVFLSNNGLHLIEYGKSFIEWMSDACQAQFNQNRDNPFSLKHLFMCYSMDELELYLNEKPTVVFAPSKNIDCSFSEDVLLRFSSDPRNLILFTNPSVDPDSLSSKLLELQNLSKSRLINFKRKFRVPLEGQELKIYLEQKRLEAASLQKANESDSESESDEDEEDGHHASELGQQIFKKRTRLAPSYPMYMTKDNHVNWDDYGEVIRIEDFLSSNETGVYIPLIDANANQESEFGANIPVTQANPAIQDTVMGNDDDDQVMGDDQEEEEIPSKDAEEIAEVEILCSVQIVSFEGVADGRSIRNILQRVSPKKMIIVKGSPEAKRHLQQFCESNVCKFVSIAKNTVTLSITSEARAFKVKLKDSLEKALRFVRIKDCEVAYIDGKLEWASGFGIPTLKRVDEAESEGHTSVFLGDVKLPDVQEALTSKHNIEAELVLGTLVCGDEGNVNVRRSENDNTISIRGSLSEDYFTVRQVLYEHFHYV